MVRYITNVKKEYNDMFRVVIYNEPRQILLRENNIKRDKSQVRDSDYEPEISSLRRTKSTIRDLILANDFDLFATFTFDPDKVHNRFSYNDCWAKIQRWVHNQRDKSPDLTYIFVPEQHKNGAWHFHALLGHFNGRVKSSGHYSINGREIFNITSYRGGFSTASYIDNPEMVANYVMKYITKDFIKIFNQRRFTCSRNLNRPIKTVNARDIDFSKPHRTVYQNGEYSLYEFPLYQAAVVSKQKMRKVEQFFTKKY